MAEVVRAALIQSRWAGDKQSMIDANVALVRQAAAQGAKVACFQELFFGPYFCQVQDSAHFSLAEPVPGGPSVELMSGLARELGMVLVAPAAVTPGIARMASSVRSISAMASESLG